MCVFGALDLWSGLFVQWDMSYLSCQEGAMDSDKNGKIKPQDVAPGPEHGRHVVHYGYIIRVRRSYYSDIEE